ncbi:MAG: glutamine-hydrolyzing GMP synthase [Bacilli bacterium]|jgi:GMP synthase (glutamine-hydrolysing)
MDKIIVINYGSQYNELIARRIRELHVYSYLVRNTIKAEEIKKDKDIKGIILSGGPNSIYDNNAPTLDKEILSLGIPVLGICYGMQLVSGLLGAKVVPGTKREYGKTIINFDDSSSILKNVNKVSQVWMSHGDEVVSVPEGFKVIAKSQNTPISALGNEEKNIFLLQFHPEVTQSLEGMKILENFINKCNVSRNWTMKTFIDDKVTSIREEVKNDKVLLGISGGVDSSVTAVLLNKAIGNQLTCLFIDNGLLRKNEAKEVIKNFKENFNIPVKFFDASEEFLTKLKGVTEPEQKRKIIGATFIDVFSREAKKFGEYKYLAQGTLYTDKVESGVSSNVIKSHHNVGGLPKDLHFKLIEPLDTLFKDEVRELGRELNMDPSFVKRQPFPGPGLGIRVIGDITKEKLDIVREADAILQEEVKLAGIDKDIWQYFCALTNLKSVGVMGDNRTYLYTVVIRAVTSIDGMTADYYRFPYDTLGKIANRIVNEVKGVNRVVYDVTSKPPATIEYE